MSGAIFFTLLVAVLLVALRLYQSNLAAIMGWPHREVQPDGAVAILFYQKFVEFLMRLIGMRPAKGTDTVLKTKLFK